MTVGKEATVDDRAVLRGLPVAVEEVGFRLGLGWHFGFYWVGGWMVGF